MSNETPLELLSSKETFNIWREKINEILAHKSQFTFATDEEFLNGEPNTIPTSGQVVGYLNDFTNEIIEILIGSGDERLGEIARLIKKYTQYLMRRRSNLTFALIFGGDDD